MSPEAESLFKMLVQLQREEMDRLAEQEPPHHLDGKPITICTQDPKEVAMELDRLKRPQWRGTPKEL